VKDIYVKFGTPQAGGKTIAGETRDKGGAGTGTANHGGWLEVTSWNHMIRQPRSATASTAGGHTAERCEHGEMIFSKDLDKVSPVLWEACSAGTSYATIEIEFFRAAGTGGRICYLKIKLLNAIVSSVVPSVVAEGLPTETFGLKYAAVQWDYVPQKIDGTADAATTGAWSLSQNKNTLAV
jgi:type VI secretion system secreted protein Hcp